MVELNSERIEEILCKETPKTEELTTIMRAIYTRYMRIFEKCFADIDALNDDEIGRLRNYHEETVSLLKYYYMDIPMKISMELGEFDEEYSSKLLGPDWHKYLFGAYNDFKAENKDGNKSEECLKAEFEKKSLEAFYEAMDSVFREEFGTESKDAREMEDGFKSLLFGE